MTGRRALAAGVLALALSLAACGGGSGGDHPSGGASSGGSTTGSTSGGGGVEAAKRALCKDLLLIQSGFRPDALQRLLDRLKVDRQAFVAAGDKATAKQVAKVAAATNKLRQALLNQKNVQQAQQAFANAIDKLPSC